MTNEQVVTKIYEAFNARNIEGVFNFLTDDVAWANGMEGTHVHGKDEIRAYWTHQWSVIDPHVSPLKMTTTADGSVIADVHQVVKDLAGKIVLDEKVVHSFKMKAGRVLRFDIPSETKLSSVKY